MSNVKFCFEPIQNYDVTMTITLPRMNHICRKTPRIAYDISLNLMTAALLLMT